MRWAEWTLAAVGSVALIIATAWEEVSNGNPHVQIGAAGTAIATLLAAAALEPRDGRRPGFALAAAISAVLLTAGLTHLTPNRDADALYIPSLAGVAVVLVQTERQSALRRSLQRERQRARLEGEERERRRWARELHDDTLQELGALKVLLASAANTGDANKMSAAIDDASRLLNGQIQSLRQLIVDLRPASLDELGLAPALEALADRVNARGGVDVHVSVARPSHRCAQEVEETVYRVVQEALTNVVRHSGARNAHVRVDEQYGQLVTTVTDDGRGIGPDARGSGLGLAGMRERAELIGGILTIGTAPEGGACVTLALPLRPH